MTLALCKVRAVILRRIRVAQERAWIKVDPPDKLWQIRRCMEQTIYFLPDEYSIYL
jgi:hypothetical protein